MAEDKEGSEITFLGTLKSPVMFIRLLNLCLQVPGFTEIQKEKRSRWMNVDKLLKTIFCEEHAYRSCCYVCFLISSETTFLGNPWSFCKFCLHQTVCDRAVVFSYFVIMVIFRNIHSIYQNAQRSLKQDFKVAKAFKPGPGGIHEKDLPFSFTHNRMYFLPFTIFHLQII